MIPSARRILPYCALALAFGACSPPVSESELAARTQNSRPEWQSYQEDIKAHIGAGPVAQWAGDPVEAVHRQPGLRVTFQMSGPWAARNAAIPMLIRDPLGRVSQNVSHESRQQTVVYDFSFPQAGSGTTHAWIEIKYPNRVKRMVFDEQGVWKAGPPSGL